MYLQQNSVKTVRAIARHARRTRIQLKMEGGGKTQINDPAGLIKLILIYKKGAKL